MGHPETGVIDRKDTGARRRGPWSMPSVARIGIVALYFAVFIGSAGVAYGQDVVITTTGDRLVGEIKKSRKGRPDARDPLFGCRLQDRVGQDVASIESKRQFVVETFDGRRVSGSLRLDPGSRRRSC